MVNLIIGSRDQFLVMNQYNHLSMNLEFLVILNTDRVTWGDCSETNLPDNLILLWRLKRARGKEGWWNWALEGGMRSVNNAITY
jgi:hypothetical protein